MTLPHTLAKTGLLQTAHPSENLFVTNRKKGNKWFFNFFPVSAIFFEKPVQTTFFFWGGFLHFSTQKPKNFILLFWVSDPYYRSQKVCSIYIYCIPIWISYILGVPASIWENHGFHFLIRKFRISSGCISPTMKLIGKAN